MAIELQWEKKRGSKWSVHIKGIQLADGAYARQIYLTERTKVSILNQMVGIFHFHFQTGSYAGWNHDTFISSLEKRSCQNS